MPSNVFVGEFEQLVLLSLLHLGESGAVLALRERMEQTAGRAVSRGALYRTLDRLEEKGWVEWSLEEEAPSRGGHVRRRFRVTQDGVAALRASRRTLEELWKGLEEVLG